MPDKPQLASFYTISTNATLLAVSQIINGFVQFGLFLLLLRLVPKPSMDAFELGRSCLEIGVGIIGSSIATVIIRENARNNQWWFTHVGTMKWILRITSFLVGFLIYTGVILVSPSLAYSIVLLPFCITIYFQSRSDIYEAFFRSHDRFVFPIVVGLICNTLIAAIILSGIYFFSHPMVWAPGGLLLRWMIQGSLFSWYVKKHTAASPVQAMPIFHNLKHLLMEISPMSIGAAAFILYARIDVLMLHWMGYNASIAIYGCAFRPIGFLFLLCSAFYQACSPSLSRLIQVNPRKALWFSLRLGFGFGLVGLVIALTLRVFSQDITYWLYPHDFSQTAEAINVLVWTLPIAFAGNAVGSFLVNQGRAGSFHYMWISIFGLLFNIIGNYIVIPGYGFIGAAWTTVMTDGITTVFMFLATLLLCARYSPVTK